MKPLSRAELRATQLKVLGQVMDYADAHGFRCFLYGGTLLGAARHKGYIPWDDDIDLLMPRPDFERFCADFARAPTGGLTLHYSGHDRRYPWPFAKVADPTTRIVESSELAMPIGINVDVFPLDGWPDSERSSAIHRRRILLWRRLLAAKSIVPRSDHSRPKRLLLYLAKGLTTLVPAGFLISRVSRLGAKFRYNESQYVGVSVWGVQERVSRTLYDDTVEIEFEGSKQPVPKGYHEILTAIYGDYMTLPPEHERSTHHAFEAYRVG